MADWPLHYILQKSNSPLPRNFNTARCVIPLPRMDTHDQCHKNNHKHNDISNFYTDLWYMTSNSRPWLQHVVEKVSAFIVPPMRSYTKKLLTGLYRLLEWNQWICSRSSTDAGSETARRTHRWFLQQATWSWAGVPADTHTVLSCTAGRPPASSRPVAVPPRL